MKSMLIAWRLIRQNWWLWLLLLLWPWGMVLLLLVGGRPAPEDAAALLQQECWYGLAMAALTAGSALGNEERSRRIELVLSRAVSRREYLLALWLMAVMPLAVYAGSCALSGLVLGVGAGAALQVVLAMLGLGAWAASLSVLGSVYLPGVLASGLGLAAVGALYWLPGRLAVAGLVRVLMGLAEPGGDGFGVVEAGMLAGVFLGVAAWGFGRRDVRLKGE